MEQLQEGYVLSVAATAGCLVEPMRRDMHGVDMMFVKPGGAQREETTLYAQLKSTTILMPDLEKGWFSFQFSRRRHFDYLSKERSTVKAVLLVMVTDHVQSRWSVGNHESLAVRKCCYWVNLEGRESSAMKPTIRVPTDQMFSAAALQGLLDRIERDEPL
jgi:hypothetical protein